MKYYLIAGEASGDLHGSNLMKGLAAKDPQAEFRFWGGDLMQAAVPQAQMVRHYRDGAVMGLTDVLAKARILLGNVDCCKKDILAWRPDVVILIDYPGFNFKIARFAHENGFKVFYYIAPKTWASREKRNARLKAWADRLFIIFPFEKDYFGSRGIPYSYQGNPLIDAVDGHEFRRPVDGRYIALLAGSRKGEISRMMPVCMEVADLLGQQIVIAGAPARSKEDYEKYIGNRKNVHLLFDRTYDILKYADAAIINSGTASLEAALIGTPQVVCWSTGALTMWAIRHIFRIEKRIKYISLGNLILDRPVFRELIQEEFNTAGVFAELRRITEDSAYRAKMKEGYRDIREALGGSGASEAIAEEMIARLKGQIS
ncbi:MAG: lipid-A-disaccharide synthase [Bacteroidales bacterium]|nr:lipid-A-disaccharide synthase [Bacteroidales bacterium]